MGHRVSNLDPEQGRGTSTYVNAHDISILRAVCSLFETLWGFVFRMCMIFDTLRLTLPIIDDSKGEHRKAKMGVQYWFTCSSSGSRKDPIPALKSPPTLDTADVVRRLSMLLDCRCSRGIPSRPTRSPPSSPSSPLGRPSRSPPAPYPSSTLSCWNSVFESIEKLKPRLGGVPFPFPGSSCGSSGG